MGKTGRRKGREGEGRWFDVNGKWREVKTISKEVEV